MKRKSIWIVITALILGIMLSFSGCKGNDYKAAMSLFDVGDYKSAASAFESLGGYKDSSVLLKECQYKVAEKEMEDGSFEVALAAFEELGEYKESEEHIAQCIYGMALELYNGKNYDEAKKLFEDAGDYEDSRAMAEKCVNQMKLQLLWGTEWMFSTKTYNLYTLKFEDGTATISGYSFDGNGKHELGTNTCSYELEDNILTVSGFENSDMQIECSINDSSIILDKKVFCTKDDVEVAIQGFWKYSENVLGKGQEHYIHFDSGYVEFEYAAESLFSNDGGYLYYGPYTGTYSIGEGQIEMTTEMHANEHFFSYYQGKVNVLRFDNVYTKSSASKLPGQYGYQF